MCSLSYLMKYPVWPFHRHWGSQLFFTPRSPTSLRRTSVGPAATSPSTDPPGTSSLYFPCPGSRIAAVLQLFLNFLLQLLSLLPLSPWHSFRIWFSVSSASRSHTGHTYFKVCPRNLSPSQEPQSPFQFVTYFFNLDTIHVFSLTTSSVQHVCPH